MLKRYWPILLILLSISIIQVGSSLVKKLFPYLGAEGLTAWRLCFSSLLFLVIFKPWKKKITLQAWKAIVPYGLSLGFMNLSFYYAIERIPIGITVAIELSGPIVVALFSARKLRDFIWLGLMVFGLFLLLPLKGGENALDPIGLLFAIGAGVGWAMYIVFGRRASQVHGPSSVAIGSILVSFLIFPYGVAVNGMNMFSLDLMPSIILVALFSSAIPYALDMISLPKVSQLTFSTLMSLAPVLGSISGFIFLGEKISLTQWFAMSCIMIASVGVIISINKRESKIKKLNI